MLAKTIAFYFTTISIFASAQLYFPPTNQDLWATVEPSAIHWNQTALDELKSYLEETHTKGFILLKDGKIVVEWYLNGHDVNKNWYWASAGKSLTSAVVGIAEFEGKLKLTDKSSKYLGEGWTSCTKEMEDKITVWNQITMTTGLDDNEFECTEPSCLTFKAEAGTRWAYHNSPYTLLDKVIENSTGQNLNLYLKEKIGDEIGMQGVFFKSGYNNVYYSTTRSMARYGLLALANGYWNGKDILKNNTYVSAMKNTSQNLNPSYGYLWWLNGKGKFMVPGLQTVFPADLIPNAPKDTYCALGKNDQKIHVVPSMNLVMVRMGDDASNSNDLASVKYDNILWDKLNKVFGITAIKNIVTNQISIIKDGNQFYSSDNGIYNWKVYDMRGQMFYSIDSSNYMYIKDLRRGLYFIKLEQNNQIIILKKYIHFE